MLEDCQIIFARPKKEAILLSNQIEYFSTFLRKITSNWTCWVFSKNSLHHSRTRFQKIDYNWSHWWWKIQQNYLNSRILIAWAFNILLPTTAQPNWPQQPNGTIGLLIHTIIRWRFWLNNNIFLNLLFHWDPWAYTLVCHIQVLMKKKSIWNVLT